MLKSTEKFILEKGVIEKDFELVLVISIYLVSIFGIYDSCYLGVNNFYFDWFILLKIDLVLCIAGKGDYWWSLWLIS